MMIISAYGYFFTPVDAITFSHLGFPAYFRIELAVAKLIGAVLLLAPVPQPIKEWTYAGFTFVFISAIIAHINTDIQVSYHLAPVIFSILLLVSYITYKRYDIVSSHYPVQKEGIKKAKHFGL